MFRGAGFSLSGIVPALLLQASAFALQVSSPDTRIAVTIDIDDDGVGLRYEVPLSFLSPDERYIATIYADADRAHWKSNPYDFVIEQRTIRNNDTLQPGLAAGGGTAIRVRTTN